MTDDGSSYGPRLPFTIPFGAKVQFDGDLNKQSPDDGIMETHRGVPIALRSGEWRQGRHSDDRYKWEEQ